MVHEPSFFTVAGHDVRKLRSRSVAVMVSLSPAASKRKLERIGMVVLRSTTPCVAVSSRNSSDLLTVISIGKTPRLSDAQPCCRDAAYYVSRPRGRQSGLAGECPRPRRAPGLTTAFPRPCFYVPYIKSKS